MNVIERFTKLLKAKGGKVLLRLRENKIISSLKTPKETQHLDYSCAEDIKSSIMETWENLNLLAIASLETPEQAKALYENCPSNVDVVAMRKWKELTTLAIASLETREEARALHDSCPSSMKPAVFEAMYKL